MKKVTLIVCFLFLKSSFFAQTKDTLATNIVSDLKTEQTYKFEDGSARSYPKPGFWQMINRLPKDFIATSKDFVANDHAYYLGGALTATVILVPLDQQITNQSRDLAERNGIISSNPYGSFGPLKVVPKNIGAGFYLIGNGATVIALGTGFITYGLLKNDYRAQATASGLMESLFLSGVYTQTIKRVTGRESPFIAIQNGHSGGDWNPFPSFSAYAKNTPYYDAMPSGHLTTIMAALTVITTNYPEYKWIKPVGYTLLGAMSYQMIQSEVHWASDYPLAIFMGYFIGKTVANNRFTETKNADGTTKKYSINFSASRNYGINMVGAAIKF
jgi:PAP2 superfamily